MNSRCSCRPLPVFCLCLAVIASPAWATEGSRELADANLLDLSLEDLMQVTVTSVSKKAQHLDETAAAVFVISAEDIRRAGVTSVPEALRLAPGVQVAAIGQNRWAVSIRGFNTRFANKLLVLVDGRAIYSPAFSGVFWEHSDVPLENIERIEVIRGPGAAVWGANAVNGVINIITRDARDTLDGQISLTAGNEVRGIGFARYGWAMDEDTHVRIHALARDMDPGRAVGGGNGPDDWGGMQGGFRLDANRGADRITLQGGVADYRAGDSITAFMAAFPYVNPALSTDGDGRNAHLLGRWERQAGDVSHAVQAYLDHSDSDLGVFRYRIDTFDIEYQQHRAAGDHDVVWGLGYRFSKDRTYDTPYVFTADSRKNFGLASAFLQDDITLAPGAWRLTLGGRFEHNAFTGFEVQPNARLLWTPDARDSLWAAVSRAVRTPSRGETGTTAFIIPPGVPPFTLPIPAATVGDPDMDSEKLAALDLGWRRQWTPSLTSELTAYYYRYADLRGAIYNFLVPPIPNGGNPYIPLTLTNTLGADTYGLEMNLDWLPRPDWRLQFNTSLFRLDVTDVVTGSTADEFMGATPGLMASLRSSWDITPRLQWDVWVRHMGKLRGNSLGSDRVSAYTTLDMSLAWKPRRDLRIALVGQNLLDPAHLEKIMTNIYSQPVEIQRAIFVKVDWKF